SLREHFVTDTGSPDWTGRTWAYKNTVIQMYQDAGYTQAQWQALGSSVRWHVGNVLRERLTDAEIADAGLLDTSPLERERARNLTRDEAVRVLHRPVEDAADTVRSLATAVTLMEKIPIERVEGLGARQRKIAREALDRIASHAELLRKHT